MQKKMNDYIIFAFFVLCIWHSCKSCQMTREKQGICRSINPIFKYTKQLVTLKNGQKCDGLGACILDCEECAKECSQCDSPYTKSGYLHCHDMLYRGELDARTIYDGMLICKCKHCFYTDRFTPLQYLALNKCKLKSRLHERKHCCLRSARTTSYSRCIPSFEWMLDESDCHCHVYGRSHSKPPFRRHDTGPCHFNYNWRRAQRMSFMLGLQTRVGKNSPVQMLPVDIVQYILKLADRKLAVNETIAYEYDCYDRRYPIPYNCCD